MKQISLYLPKSDIDALDKLVNEGFYPSRNEAIRLAVRDLVQHHSESVQELKAVLREHLRRIS